MTAQLVAVGSASSQKITTSPDAITWTLQGQGGWSPTDNPLDIAFSPSLNLFVAVTPKTNGVYTSPDGLTWTQQTSTSFAPRGVSWSEALALFVVVGGGDGIVSSPDGVTWTSRRTGSVNHVLNAVRWSAAAGLFMTVGADTTGGAAPCRTSPDGVTWTVKATPLQGPFSVQPCEDVAYDPASSRWCVVGGSGRIGRSTNNGTTWTSVVAAGSNCFGVDWSPSAGVFVTVDALGTAWSSPDAATWTNRGAVVGGLDVEWVDDLGLFVLVGSGGGISTSTNGTSFTSRTSGHAQTMNAVTWGAPARPRGILVGSVAA